MSRDPKLDQLDSLHSVLQSINASLADLAVMTRLPLLYTSEEIKQLAQQCKRLADADAAAYRATNEALAAIPEKEGTRDAMVQLYGQEETNRRYAPFDQATKAKQDAYKAFAAFSKEHPLIERLVRGSKAK